MILHFLTDNKFSEYVLRQFSPTEMSSKFVVITENDYLSNVYSETKVSILRPYSDDFYRLVNQLSDYKAVVFHGLFWPWEEYVLKIVPSNVKVAWMFWGGEIYGRNDIKYSFLAPLTKRLFLWKNIKHTIKRLGKKEVSYEIPKELFNRIDYCLTDIPGEYCFAKDYLGNSMSHIWYNYYSIEDTLGDAVELSVQGDNILVGNSGTIEGNHLDVLRLIDERDMAGRKVIVPLSYGDSWLKTRIKKEGKARLKNTFVPLTDFMPRSEYNHVLSTCSTVIMNHYRPQAMGNIITTLWLGARVFMSEKSIQYKYLKDNGIVLFSIEKDLVDKRFSFKRLPEEDVLHNRQVLCAIYGRDVMSKKILELVIVLNQ